MFLSFESSNARKISLEGGGGGGGGVGGGGNQDPGDPGVGKVRGKGFFFLQAGGGGTDPGGHYVVCNKLTFRERATHLVLALIYENCQNAKEWKQIH